MSDYAAIAANAVDRVLAWTGISSPAKAEAVPSTGLKLDRATLEYALFQTAGVDLCDPEALTKSLNDFPELEKNLAKVLLEGQAAYKDLSAKQRVVALEALTKTITESAWAKLPLSDALFGQDGWAGHKLHCVTATLAWYPTSGNNLPAKVDTGINYMLVTKAIRAVAASSVSDQPAPATLTLEACRPLCPSCPPPAIEAAPAPAAAEPAAAKSAPAKKAPRKARPGGTGKPPKEPSFCDKNPDNPACSF